MKKTVSILILTAILALTLSACGAGNPKIEDHEWKMRVIMHVEDDQVIYDATAEEQSSCPEAKIVDMTLVADNGKITITDITNDKVYEGTYTVSGRNPKGTDYHITIDGRSGYATVAMTTYADGTQEPTLPITFDGYSMYFYAD